MTADAGKPKTALVVGAGIVGVASAYALARRGIEVTIVDGREGPALGASFANGAQLSYLYTDALASPALLSQIPALLRGKVESIRLRYSADPEYLLWLARFLRNCTASRFARNTRAALELALESRAAMDELLQAHPLEFAHKVPGKLHIYRSRPAFERLRDVLAVKQGCGADNQRILTAEETLVVEPALASSAPAIFGALYSPGEEVGDAHRFSHALLTLMQEQYGLQAAFGFEATRLQLGAAQATATAKDGRSVTADIVVLCTGHDANALLRPQGLRVPVIPMKGYSFTAPPGSASPQVSITEMDARFVVTRLDGQVRIAGLADLGQRDTRVDPARLQSLVDRARTILPFAADYDARYMHWAGLRPMSPDSRPLIEHPRPALAYNLGHGILGWTMAMGSGERLAKLVVGEA